MKTPVLLLIATFFTLSVMAQVSEQQIASYPFKAETKKIEPFQYLYYEYKGAYMNAFTAFPQLVEYIENEKIETDLYSLGVYYDDPSQVAENDLRSEIGMMVKEKVKSDRYKCKKVEGFKAATIRYNNMAEIQTAYAALAKYMQEKNLTPVGPSYEFYYSYDENNIDAEIIFPVK